MVDDEMEADIIIVNTCCFIHDAKEESIQTILEMAQYKTDGRLKVLVVTGCLAQRYQLRRFWMRYQKWMRCWEPHPMTRLSEAVEEALAGKGHVEVEDNRRAAAGG